MKRKAKLPSPVAVTYKAVAELSLSAATSPGPLTFLLLAISTPLCRDLAVPGTIRERGGITGRVARAWHRVFRPGVPAGNTQ
jgi:hypothetical protein